MKVEKKDNSTQWELEEPPARKCKHTAHHGLGNALVTRLPESKVLNYTYELLMEPEAPRRPRLRELHRVHAEYGISRDPLQQASRNLVFPGYVMGNAWIRGYEEAIMIVETTAHIEHRQLSEVVSRP
ncbi:hypothetical protein V5799_023484 [Amblyomma americanum]|uniref:Uncharacterized protein n=1 Tax=Amblyomma americanum TaxID=6943 RepID=A0AAQ4FJJ6_AMBAM